MEVLETVQGEGYSDRQIKRMLKPDPVRARTAVRSTSPKRAMMKPEAARAPICSANRPSLTMWRR